MILPGMDGLDLVSTIQEIERDLPLLVMTHVSSVQSAVEAMRRGAYDDVLKPLNPSDRGMRLYKAIRVSGILRRHASLERIVRQSMQHDSLLGSTAPFQEVLRRGAGGGTGAVHGADHRGNRDRQGVDRSGDPRAEP
jgi:two-component system C4-dicarboxylate transport response regulator DctD